MNDYTIFDSGLVVWTHNYLTKQLFCTCQSKVQLHWTSPLSLRAKTFLEFKIWQTLMRNHPDTYIFHIFSSRFTCLVVWLGLWATWCSCCTCQKKEKINIKHFITLEPSQIKRGCWSVTNLWLEHTVWNLLKCTKSFKFLLLVCVCVYCVTPQQACPLVRRSRWTQIITMERKTSPPAVDHCGECDVLFTTAGIWLTVLLANCNN